MSQKMVKKVVKASADERTALASSLQAEIGKVRTQKAKKVINLSATELASKSASIEAELFKARMKNSVGQLANIASVWGLRKELARVKTQISRMEKSGLLKQKTGA